MIQRARYVVACCIALTGLLSVFFFGVRTWQPNGYLLATGDGPKSRTSGPMAYRSATVASTVACNRRAIFCGIVALTAAQCRSAAPKRIYVYPRRV